MKKIILGVVVAGIILVGGAGLFLILQKDASKVAEMVEEVQEEKSPRTDSVSVDPLYKGDASAQVKNKIVKTGTFNYLDPLHNGSGGVSVVDVGEFYKIKMGADFKSADAPDPYVYLGSTQEFKDKALNGVDTSKTINLGKLKAFTGEQEYLVSKKDFETYDAAVIIWCKRFGIQISRADLK